MFVFKELRRSIKSKNMLIVQGWCDSGFLTDAKVGLNLTFKDGSKDFPAAAQVDKLSPLNYFTTPNGYLAFLVTISIKVDEEMKTILKYQKGSAKAEWWSGNCLYSAVRRHSQGLSESGSLH